MEWALNRLWLEQGEIFSDWQFYRFPPCRQGKYFWNPVLTTAAPVTCTRLFLGQKYRLSCVSRKLRFFRCGSRTLFFPMTYMARKPVTNLNAFQKSGEVFNDLWLHTTVPLLKNYVNHDTENNSESHANQESEFRVNCQNFTRCFNCLSVSNMSRIWYSNK